MVADSLHRLSLIYPPRGGEPCGVTLRIGRSLIGVCSYVEDLLADDQRSILLLGPIGCGKTTVLRDIVRSLAERGARTAVIDTTGELGGAGTLANPGIGRAWRVGAARGATVLRSIESACESHSPQVIVIDRMEMEAAIAAGKYCREAGIRFICAVRGCLSSAVRSLLDKSENGMISGSAFRQDVAINTLVELPPLCRGQRAWRIVRNTRNAMDSLMEGRPIACQQRARDPFVCW